MAVSLINGGIARPTNDEDLAFLGPRPKKVGHEGEKNECFLSTACLGCYQCSAGTGWTFLLSNNENQTSWDLLEVQRN